MQTRLLTSAILLSASLGLASLAAQPPQGRGAAQFPGGTNPDGSLRPSRPNTALFTQDAYTEYELLEPGSESFRIKFLPEESRVGAIELVNATRGGSEGSGIEVYDPRTGKALPFTYEQQGNDPESHAIRAKLPIAVPEGGVGRVLIYKTYKDARTYMMNGEDLVWVRSLSGYRLGVVLPKGFAFLSSNVAAQVLSTPDGRLRLAFANPSGQANPVTIHARRSGAVATAAPGADMFFDDVRTLYELDAPETGRVRVQQTYSDYRKGARAMLDQLGYLPLTDLQVVDLDTAKVLTPARVGTGMSVPLDVPIVDDRQSAHLKVTGSITDAAAYRLAADELVFTRQMKGLRNTIVLPAGWDVTGVSQSATIGVNQGRVFAALINLNSENTYTLTLRAKRR